MLQYVSGYMNANLVKNTYKRNPYLLRSGRTSLRKTSHALTTGCFVRLCIFIMSHGHGR
jgi:hypothetical protein